MQIADQIKNYVESQPEPKRNDLFLLHQTILAIAPKCKLWFLDGKNEDGKTVTNPNIGYGTTIMKLAGGKSTEFYQVGISANTTGISVYIMGLEDKKYLVDTYGSRIGKATITGYCIKFKSLEVINQEVLKEAMMDALK